MTALVGPRQLWLRLRQAANPSSSLLQPQGKISNNSLLALPARFLNGDAQRLGGETEEVDVGAASDCGTFSEALSCSNCLILILSSLSFSSEKYPSSSSCTAGKRGVIFFWEDEPFLRGCLRSSREMRPTFSLVIFAAGPSASAAPAAWRLACLVGNGKGCQYFKQCGIASRPCQSVSSLQTSSVLWLREAGGRARIGLRLGVVSQTTAPPPSTTTTL
mmetsp:Transcript_96685/g.202072  ORF Transcript_96685/g.202072 Transcript_96685/m.202072 type:complete len:218 (-) Transcript_96685:35-688(-)